MTLLLDSLVRTGSSQSLKFHVKSYLTLFSTLIGCCNTFITGGLGLAPSGNMGADGVAVFEAVHGTADACVAEVRNYRRFLN